MASSVNGKNDMYFLEYVAVVTTGRRLFLVFGPAGDCLELLLDELELKCVYIKYRIKN